MLLPSRTRIISAVRDFGPRWLNRTNTMRFCTSLAVRKHVAVVGGGISGLAMAYYLKTLHTDPSIKVTLIEKEHRVGGWVQTNHGPSSSSSSTSPSSSAVFESGPRSIRIAKTGPGEETLKLAVDLGLADHIIPAAPASRNRFLYVDGKLRPLPTSVWSLLSSSLLRPAIFPVLSECLKPSKAYPTGGAVDESIHSFFSRRFGDYVASTFVAAIVCGIYGGDSTKLSVLSCFPSLVALEQDHGSVLRGMLFGKKKQETMTPKRSGVDAAEGVVTEQTRELLARMRKAGVFSFTGGVQALTDALHARLLDTPGVEVKTNTSVSRLTFSAVDSAVGGPARLVLSSSSASSPSTSVLDVDEVCWCTSPSSLADVSANNGGGDDERLEVLRSLLRDVESGGRASMVSINFGYRTDDTVEASSSSSSSSSPSSSTLFTADTNGFGYLIPPKESQQILGVTYDSSVFPSQFKLAADADVSTPVEDAAALSLTRVTVMLGGARNDRNRNWVDVKSHTDEELVHIARGTLREHMGVTREPDVSIVNRCHDAIPQYAPGHQEAVAKLETMVKKDFPMLSLLGNAYQGVGINDCIERSKAAAEQRSR